MAKTIQPLVTLLAQGKEYTAKQMQAKSGSLLPKHHANLESIVFIFEGECVLTLDGKEVPLKPGEAVVIPPFITHQIRVISDFKGIHFMPKDIQFQFFQ